MALLPFRSRIISDVGFSLGDEGKGRLIPELVAELQETTGNRAAVGMVLKVNGGANSGHTAGGLKLNLIPSGIVTAEVSDLAIGAGVVADPRKFLWELAYLGLHGYDAAPRLRIDERTMLSDVSHRLLDLSAEDYRVRVLGAEPRGSTGRGISPAFTDEAAHTQIPYAVFLGERAAFAQRMHFRLQRAAATARHVYGVSAEFWHAAFDRLTTAEHRANQEALAAGVLAPHEVDFGRFRGSEPWTFDADAVIEAYWNAGRALAGSITDVRERVRANLEAGRTIIGEHGQSFWLDKRHGFPPNVTASHTGVAELFQSAALPLQPVHVIGVVKAYDTKVGTHEFLTRIPADHPLHERLSRLEFGTSTGRQRAVGWCDAVEKGDALRYHGADDLMINKVDALGADSTWSGGVLRIATHYRGPDGTEYHHVPRDEALRARLTPVYRDLPSWTEDLGKVRSWAGLPRNARRYLAAIMRATIEVAFRGERWPDRLPNLRYVGVGPDPSQIIRDIPAPAELLAEAD